jgi:hypothetical protein
LSYYLFYFSGTIQIKTEEDDLVDIIPVDDPGGSGMDANNHSKVKTLKRDIIDLTIDSDDEDSPTRAKQSKTEEDTDVKPDITYNSRIMLNHGCYNIFHRTEIFIGNNNF